MDTAPISSDQLCHKTITLACSNIPFPLFFVENDDNVILINRRFAEYMRLDPVTRNRIPILELETLLNCAVKSALRKAINTGVTTMIDDAVITDASGERKFASIYLIPSMERGNHDIPSCTGIVVDSTKWRHMEQRLNIVQSELSIVSQVSAQLGPTMEIEDIFKIILIAVTAKEGIGFNRAFLFLLDEEQVELTGCHAIGPVDAEEAGIIWRSIPDKGEDLRTIIRSYRDIIHLENMETDRAVTNLRFSVCDGCGPFANAIFNRKPITITDERQLKELNEQVGSLFGMTELAIAPLCSRDKVLGLIAADNLITNRPIADSDLEQLQMFASQAAIAIERARLYENLQSYIKKLETVNRQLEKTHRQIIRIEKLTLMGEMIYRIAHELRNPLTIIGGFANLLLKSDGMSEIARERAEIVQNECRRIEKQLEKLLDFSRSYSQEKEEIDLNLLVKDVVDMAHPQFLKLGVTIESSSYDFPVLVCVHKDQLLHGLYIIVVMLSELSPQGTLWRVSALLDSGVKKIEIIPDDQSIERKEAISVLEKFIDNRARAGDLRFPMANEAIIHNGADLGLELHKNQPRVYITFESRGQNYA